MYWRHMRYKNIVIKTYWKLTMPVGQYCWNFFNFQKCLMELSYLVAYIALMDHFQIPEQYYFAKWDFMLKSS